MKKGFTLIEVLLSVSLIAIVIVFLYQTLDVTKGTNKFYKEKLDGLKTQNNIKLLMFEDMINKEGNSSSVQVKNDRNDNTILQFQSSNTFHNPFSNNITYLVTKENNLVRCESKEIFDTKKVYKFLDDSFAYIDIVDSNVTKFSVAQGKKDKKNYVIYIQYSDNRETFFTLKPLI
jgi:prepilin-type N-terminal cleavage/methylation domain-containing protein